MTLNKTQQKKPKRLLHGVSIFAFAFLMMGLVSCSDDDSTTNQSTEVETDTPTSTDSDTVEDTNTETNTSTETGTYTADTETETPGESTDGTDNNCPALETVAVVDNITQNTAWPAAIYQLDSSLYISGGTLSVAPCSVIKVPNSATIEVSDNGAINMVGTPQQPITITSGKPIPAVGDWAQIEIDDSSNNLGNIMENVIVEYGGANAYGSIWIDSGASLAMTNSTVRHSGDVGISMENDAHLRDFTGNSLINNAKGPVSLDANSVDDLGGGIYAGNTVEGIIIRGGTVSHDATWLNHDVPYVTTSSFSISTDSGSAHLTIMEGTTLKMSESSNIDVGQYGGLSLAGTATSPVTITSVKDIPAAGDWGQIEIDDASVDANNVFTYAVIEHGGGSSYGSVWVDSGASLATTNSTVRYSGHVGISLEDDGHLRDFTGNTLTNNAKGPISLDANSVDELGAGIYAGNDVEGIIITGGTVIHDATWLNLDAPYVTASSFGVNSDSGSAHLTLMEGTTLKINEGGTIDVGANGGLTLAGTVGSPVLVTCAKPVCSPGDWNQIEITADSVNAHNVFTYASIEYGGGSSYGQLWIEDGAEITLENSTFSNAGSTGCDVDNDGGAAIPLGTNAFVQCPN